MDAKVLICKMQIIPKYNPMVLDFVYFEVTYKGEYLLEGTGKVKIVMREKRTSNVFNF
jgi:hypothetical protein